MPFLLFQEREMPVIHHPDLSAVLDREELVVIFYTRAHFDVVQGKACPTDGIAPLEDWEEGQIRARAARYLAVMNGDDDEALGRELMALYQPLKDEAGRPAEIDFRRSFWMHDIAHRLDELANVDAELLVMKEVADFFHDGKPFSMIRLLAMKAAQVKIKDVFNYGRQA